MTKERPAFNTDGTFVCRIKFRFNGFNFVKGDEFPHKDLELDCPARRLQSLYSARYIDPAKAEDFEESIVYDPGTCEIVSPEKGVWLIKEDGYEDVRITPKEAQRLKRVKAPNEVNPGEIVEEE